MSRYQQDEIYRKAHKRHLVNKEVARLRSVDRAIAESWASYPLFTPEELKRAQKIAETITDRIIERGARGENWVDALVSEHQFQRPRLYEEYGEAYAEWILRFVGSPEPWLQQRIKEERWKRSILGRISRRLFG